MPGSLAKRPGVKEIYLLALFGFGWVGAQELPELQAELSKEKPGSADWLACWKGCSLACGVPWTVKASSSLRPQGKLLYTPSQAQDGKASTAWVEGSKGNGAGEWLECEFHGKSESPVNFTGISLASGYQKSVTTFLDNARPRTLLVSVNGEAWARLHLADSQSIQNFGFAGRQVKRGDRLRMTIVDVYPGRRFSDCCITEFILNGGH